MKFVLLMRNITLQYCMVVIVSRVMPKIVAIKFNNLAINNL
jgi:hypothetical protein